MGDEKDDNIRQRFGKYFILDHLVDGGMAKIYRARFLGEEADKIIAIKMIKSQFSSDPNFKKMFLDELNVIFGFEHPNVINTFDYGMNKGQLFVAMEYCDGKSVYEYIKKLKDQNCHIPIDITVSIVSQICRGLNYVHKYTDKLTGKKKDIIHRDISPHNIMLGYEGAVKVIDFGIAKVNADSKVNSDATQSGTIKGKISYLAPEYIEGADLDHRYDQFATGITLWEMLCGKKLFNGTNNMSVLKKIQQCEVPPPSSINSNVPKELDEIVLKSLSRERKNRYENMDKFDRSLMKFLNTHYPDFHSSDVGYFAESLFKEEIESDRKKLFEFGKIDIKPHIEALKKEQKNKRSNEMTNPTGTTGSGSLKTKRTIAVFDFEDNDKRYVKTNDAYDDEFVTSASFDNVLLKIKKSINEKKMMNKTEKSEGAKKEKSRHKYEWQKTRSTLADKSKNKVQWTKIVAGAAVVCFVFWGILSKRDARHAGNNNSTSRSAASLNDNMAKQPAILILENFNRYEQTLFVNGKKIEVDIYSNAKVNEGREVIVRVESKNKRPYVVKTDIASGERKRLDIPRQEREQFAQLRAQGANCPRGQVSFYLYGEKRVLSVPFGGLYSFPLKGDGDARVSGQGFAVYELTFKDQNSRAKKIDIEFQSVLEPINLCDRL